jgi:hypothetical protein
MLRMPRPGPGVRGAALAAILALVSCKRSAPTLVNQDFQFSIRWPGEGWTLLDAREARAIVPDAVAGARGRKGVHGAVIVENIDPPDLEAVARQMADNVGVRDKQTSPFARLDFAGEKAVRWGTTGTINGMSVRFEHTVFAHQKHLYQVLAFAAGQQARADGSDFRPFTEAFALLPGPVRDRAESVKVADMAGVGWRVRGGIYESAVYGLRVVPRAGWHVSVGAELARMNGSAEFGLARSSPQAFVVLLAERAPPEAERPAYADGIVGRTVRTVGGSLTGPPLRHEVGGVSVPLTEYVSAGALPMRYLHGILFHGPEALQLVGWTTAGEGDAGRAAVLEGLDAIELLDDAGRTALRQELEGKADPQSQVGPEFSFRRDVYRDFGRGFSFRRTGLWRLAAGDRARAHHEGATLWLDQPSLGVMAFVTVSDPSKLDPLEGHHHEVAIRLDKVQAGPLPAKLGGFLALRSEGLVQSEAVRLRWEVNTLARDHRIFAVNVWGLPADMAAAREAIDQMLGDFEFGGPQLEPPAARDGRYRDERLGFSYAPPPGDWQAKDITPAGVAADMHLRGWSRAGREIIVGALGISDQAPGAALKGMEARMRSMMGSDVQRAAALLAGQPCQKASVRKGLSQMEMYVLERDGIAYVLILSAPFIGHGSFFQEAPAGFAFLD